MQTRGLKSSKESSPKQFDNRARQISREEAQTHEPKISKEIRPQQSEEIFRQLSQDSKTGANKPIVSSDDKRNEFQSRSQSSRDEPIPPGSRTSQQKSRNGSEISKESSPGFETRNSNNNESGASVARKSSQKNQPVSELAEVQNTKSMSQNLSKDEQSSYLPGLISPQLVMNNRQSESNPPDSPSFGDHLNAEDDIIEEKKVEKENDAKDDTGMQSLGNSTFNNS